MTDVTAQIIKRPELAIDQAQPFLDFLAFTKAVNEAWERVEQVMLDNHVKSVKGDWGTLSIGERKSWIVEHELPPEFYKKQLDTAKLNALYKADIIPAGVDYMVKPYLTRRLK